MEHKNGLRSGSRTRLELFYGLVYGEWQEMTLVRYAGAKQLTVLWVSGLQQQ